MGGACVSIKSKTVKSKQKNGDNNEKKIPDKENENKDLKDKETKDNQNQKENSPKEITFKIIYKDKEYSEKVKTSEKISHLFTLIKKYQNNKYSEFDLIFEENISLSSKLNEEISEVFKNKEDITLKMLYLGLEISFDIKKEIEISNTLIAQPLFDLGENIGLLIYHKLDNNFTSEILKSQKLSKYNHLSAYCTCKNVLFICGGESKENKGTNNRNYISNFTKIDLFNTETINELPMLEQARAWHSMIFVPPKLIFIIGGDTKTVELFDIERGELNSDSEMNEIRNECTLFCLNDAILYAFSGVSINGNYIKNIEKCNLRAEERKWKIIEIKNNEIQIQNCFYISCFTENSSNIILFAENENENHSYDSLEFEEEEEKGKLKVFNSNMKITDVCPDKTFHPINNNMSILLPLIGNHVSVYYTKKEFELEKKSFPDALKQIYD